MRHLPLQSKRNVSMHGYQKRLEGGVVVVQTSISGEEQERRSLAVGKMSREAMRRVLGHLHMRTIFRVGSPVVIAFHAGKRSQLEAVRRECDVARTKGGLHITLPEPLTANM